MEANELLFTRRSIRAYEDKPIPQAVLDRIFDAAMMAPSWKNTQTAGYVVVSSPEMKSRVIKALPSFNASSAQNAPVIVIMTTKKGRSGYNRDGSFSTKKEDRWEIFDAGIACQTLCLAAWNEGIGTCIMGIYDETLLPEIISLPEDETITAVIPMGYPAISPEAPKRKAKEDKVRYV